MTVTPPMDKLRWMLVQQLESPLSRALRISTSALTRSLTGSPTFMIVSSLCEYNSHTVSHLTDRQ